MTILTKTLKTNDITKSNILNIINSNFPHQKWDSHIEKSIL